MEDYRGKFQDLLRQLFQFDCADLDFGIYRIMNHKREAVERFIQKDLVEAIGKELSSGILASDARAAEEMKELAGQIRESLGESAINGDGVLAEQFHGTPLGKRYLDLQARVSGAQARPALEAAIFNHLYAFFSRYYDAGDFLSKRRYGRKEKYAIPYNGEEVHLHWANSDQYYVKTGEYFTDYRFASRGLTVHFKLQQADVPQNNVKGDKRFFVPLTKEASFDAKAREIVVPFEFRPLTDQEQVRYGQRDQQDAVVAEALKAIPKRLEKHNEGLGALLAVHHQTAEGEEVSFLAHHLRQYTRRNTSDFFIHKDLKGFLTRELDFYLKNEVLSLDELEAAGESRAEGWFQVMRAIKAIGGRIIEFLAQIEEFQKMLFEKRKFVTETQYCITVDNIDEAFYAEIAANDAQWDEWKELFHIDEAQQNLFNANAKSKKDRRIAFLKAHPTLVLDTKHFDTDFVDRLLASFGDLDEMTDGLLVHSENFQALNLLLEKCREKVKCVYIDPPFNSKATEILYKNTYKHSSWLSLMENRLALSRLLTGSEGLHIVAIDENEQERLGLLLQSQFPEQQITAVSVIHNPRGIQGDNFSYCHEYAYFVYPPTKGSISPTAIPEAEWEYSNLRNWGGESLRTDGKSCFYPIVVKNGKIVEIGKAPADDFHPKGQNVHRRDGSVEVWPIDRNRVERKWRYAPDSLKVVLHTTKVAEEDDKIEILIARSVEMRKTVWVGPQYDAGTYGSRLLTNMVEAPFSFPKSLHTVEDCILATGCKDDDLVVDYFAGSGTTGHAAIALNRDDGGHRRFILAEMGEYFDPVLLPRIKKATFAPEWKDRKPARQATAEEAERSPRIVKYIRLESYEDALNNIMFTGASKTLYDFDDYMLRYMLKWETKESPTLLNVEQLASPFSYKLRITEGQETREKVVDTPETFAYLLGLHVTTRRALQDKDRRYVVYRGKIDHREVVVIWRDTASWEKADYERDKKFVAEQKLTEGTDEVFVNGDGLIPGARSLDGVFKARMFAPVGV